MHIFYVPAATAIGQTIALPDTEAQHAVRVLRLRNGDRIEIANGQGMLYEAEITAADNKRASACLLGELPTLAKRKVPVQIAVAPTKNLDRMEWLVEKATEIGCDDFIFLLCRHSERKELKLERLEKVAVSAMKQSKQPYLPHLHTLQPFASFIKTADAATTVIAHLTGEENQPTMADVMQQHPVSTVIIGPEGDFSPEELQIAADAGIKAVKLGQSRLRTETAALVACTTLTILAT